MHVDQDRRQSQQSFTSGEDSVFSANEIGEGHRRSSRKISDGNRFAERVKRLSPKQRRHSSHSSSPPSPGFAGHDNLAFISEDDETAENADDGDSIARKNAKNSIVANAKDEDMSDSTRKNRRTGTGEESNWILKRRQPVGPDTFTTIEAAQGNQANGSVPTDKYPE